MSIDLQSIEEKVILGSIQKGWGVERKETERHLLRGEEETRRTNTVCVHSVLLWGTNERLFTDYLKGPLRFTMGHFSRF